MTSLPQRKKSPEEIARLRETLGIPDGGHHEDAETPPPATHEAAVVPAPAPTPAPSAREPKPIRSLRKSEQLPAVSHLESPPDSPLPHHRHSDEEIAEIRRRETLALMNTQPNAKLFPAHPALIIPGYLSAFAGAAGFYFYQFPIAATLGFVTFSLAIAVIIGIRKPVSRHHAAFISVIALFVLVFGALHYFPLLRHAT